MRRARIHPKKIILSAAFFLIAAAALAGFSARAPALLVTDASFAAMYGTLRTRQQQVLASLALFRRVKQVIVADGIGADVLILAVEEAASRPYCVLFPRRYREGAELYEEQHPAIPVLLLEGRSNKTNSSDAGTGPLLTFTTDRQTDFYRAGLCAGILGRLEPAAENGEADGERETRPAQGKIVFFIENPVKQEDRDNFIRGLREQGLETNPLFLDAASRLTDTRDVSCVVVAGAGAEYLEKNLKIPVILFTWLNPSLTSRETALIFDDSLWALAVPVIRTATRQKTGGQIPSKVLIFSSRIADNHILKELKKAPKKIL